MTFSQLVKEELVVQDIHPETAKVELMAAFKAIGTLEQDFNNTIIELKSSQIKLIKRILEIIKHEYPKAQTQTLVRTIKKFNEEMKLYVLRINTYTREILVELGLIDDINQFLILSLNDVSNRLITDEEKRAFVKMFYICSGTVNDPKKSQQYHLEINGNNREYLSEIKGIVKKYDINFKFSRRKNSNVLYINKSEEIADFLKFIESFDLLFEFEDYRLTRDINLVNNRLNNAEIANETRKLTSIQKQVSAIEKLKASDELKFLPEKTQLIAKLREEYPDDSLQELADRTNGEISKSNIRHHLNNIIKKSEM